MRRNVIAILLVIGLILMVQPCTVFAARHTIANQEQLKNVLSEAVDGDEIMITTSLNLTETIVIPAKKLTIMIGANITSTATPAFRVSDGASVVVYAFGSIQVPENGTIFENAGNVGLLNPFGTLGDGTTVIANNTGTAVLTVPGGGTYNGAIRAEDTATVTLSHLGNPKFSQKPDARFAERGCEFVDTDGDGWWTIQNNNIIELQYRTAVNKEMTEQYLTLQEATAKELDILSNSYFDTKYLLLLDSPEGVTFNNDLERTIFLRGHTITGDVVLNKGKLIIKDNEENNGLINGSLKIGSDTSATLVGGTIKYIEVASDGVLEIADTGTVTVSENVFLEPNASIKTIGGMLTNNTSEGMAIPATAISGVVEITVPVAPTPKPGYIFEGWKINGTVYKPSTLVIIDTDSDIIPIWTVHDCTMTVSDKGDETGHILSCECGKTQVEAHSFGKAEQITAPTTTTKGINRITCTKCGFIQEQEVPCITQKPRIIAPATGDRNNLVLIPMVLSLSVLVATVSFKKRTDNF